MEQGDAAQGIPHLVLLHGRERARELVPAKQRPLVDIAAEVLADDARGIGISYAGFCLTSLPHKRLPDDRTWRKQGHKVTLLVEPGSMIFKGRETRYGVPLRRSRTNHLLFLSDRKQSAPTIEKSNLAAR